MKRLILSLMVIIGLYSFARAQTPGVLSGQVYNTPPPGSGFLVTMTIYNGFSPIPGAILLIDTVRTDSLGHYTLPYVTPAGAFSGLIYARVTNCQSGSTQDSAFWNTTTSTNPVINLDYCPGGLCTADFIYTTTGLNVNFNNTSTPVSSSMLYLWNFGDGDTSNVQNPSHTYNVPGSYIVSLRITDSLMACLDTFIDTVIVNSIPTIVVAGNVTTSGSLPGPSKVFLIAADANQVLSAVDSLNLTSGNNYSFNVTAGTYYVKAGLSNTNPDLSSYLPTYFNNSLTWSSATGIVVTTASSFGNNINLVQGVNPGGPAFIGGLVTEGENKSAGPGDPVSNVSVILTDEFGSGVAHTLTDANGKYEFDLLAYGTYKVFVEIIGKTTHDRTVVLSASNERVENANFIVGQKEITTGLLENSNIAVTGAYPNPATDVVRIGIEVKEYMMARLVITDLAGREMLVRSVSLKPGSQLEDINVNDYPKGIYMIHLVTDKITSTVKLVKY